jgi:hypothetical protein
VYETESEDYMINIRRKVLSVAVILLGILITFPTLYAQSPNNNRGRQTRQRTTLQQNMPKRQRPVIRARQTARQNWWLRFVNRLQRIKLWKLRTQVRQNRIEQRREYRRHFTQNHHNYNNNYNNHHWGRP